MAFDLQVEGILMLNSRSNQEIPWKIWGPAAVSLCLLFIIFLQLITWMLPTTTAGKHNWS